MLAVGFAGLISLTWSTAPSRVKQRPKAITGIYHPRISPDIPTDVNVPPGPNDPPDAPIRLFDDYSWRAFIGLLWPVAEGQRGVPDRRKPITDPGPKVFETFKSTWEIYHDNGSPPAPWNEYDQARFNRCRQRPKFGQVDIAALSHFTDDVAQPTSFGQDGPIASVNRSYVRYLAGVNKTEFCAIKSRGLYLRANLPQNGSPLALPSGSINVKSAWIEMSGIPNPSHYYTRWATVYDYCTKHCVRKRLGLIGLHIVQKTPSRPQWIWSTFEQVDDVPFVSSRRRGGFSLHRGSAPMRDSSPNSDEHPPCRPLFTNIDRLRPIDYRTDRTNRAYQAALRRRGSVLQYYRLIMTQWPVSQSDDGNIPVNQAATPAFTFPGLATTTAFNSPIFETFLQKNIQDGCMSCHGGTRGTDFVWTMAIFAHTGRGPAYKLNPPEFTKLRELLATPHHH